MPILTSRCKNILKAVKHYAKTDIKVFWSCPILVDLKFFAKYFTLDCSYIKMKMR